MARDSNPDAIGFAWDPDPGADDYLVYMDTSDSENFLELVDSGMWPVHATVTDPEYRFATGDPSDADWAVVSHATVTEPDPNNPGQDREIEHWSDPYSPDAWQDINTEADESPLAGLSNGRVLIQS